MITFMFPGQGAQAKGMGKNLFDEFPEYTKKADNLLGYSIKELCLEDPAQHLNQTAYTQPALFVVSALSYLKKRNDNKKPDYVAGHSLGEYSALFAANVFDFEIGLQLVKKRGELMSQAENGGMAAIVGWRAEKISEFLQQNALDTLSIANYNSYTQSVITGPKDDIQRAQQIFQKNKEGAFIPLNVSGAFHSPYMLPAQNEFKVFLNKFKFNVPTIPIIANVNAEIYHPAIIKDNLAQQITSPVLWTKTIEVLKTMGQMEFEEVGPGMVLSNLLKKILSGQ